MREQGFLGLGMIAGLGLALIWSACTPVVRTIEGTGGHGGEGTGGTGGSAPACKPGDMVTCYDGPAGTEGVGQCAPGKAMCGSDGKPTGPCVGEILPAKQVECKLAKLDPGGAHLASKAFAMGGYMALLGIAAGPKSIAVAGATLFPVDLGGGVIGQQQIADPIVATFAP